MSQRERRRWCLAQRQIVSRWRRSRAELARIGGGLSGLAVRRRARKRESRRCRNLRAVGARHGVVVRCNESLRRDGDKPRIPTCACIEAIAIDFAFVIAPRELKTTALR